jgi:hypothetical protein
MVDLSLEGYFLFETALVITRQRKRIFGEILLKLASRSERECMLISLQNTHLDYRPDLILIMGTECFQQDSLVTLEKQGK